MAQQHYQTNLASEFYVMSILYRRGLDVYLTLGNKKAVDIVVRLEDNTALTIDVKANAGKMDWLMGSGKAPRIAKDHFVVLMSYEDKFEDLQEQPRIWVVPYEALQPFIGVASNGTTHYISRKQFIAKCAIYENAWDLLTNRR